MRRIVAPILLSIVPSLAAAAAPGGGIEGLDSLASATLTRSLDILGIRPEELGFDKLYMEDDTFRLGIVEELLNRPLELPGWQARTVEAVRDRAGDPPRLLAFLGQTCEAPDPDAVPGAESLRGARDAFLRGGDAAGTLQARVDEFVSACRRADASLQRAFAGLNAADRSVVLVLAPAFWGDWEDPGSTDTRRKGSIHFETGATADTSIKLTDHPILDASVKVERLALTRGSDQFLSALIDLAAAVGRTRLPDATETLPGVLGPIVGSFDTPWGLLVVGGPEPNTYTAEALARIAFVIEPGGDDAYRGRSASAVGGLTRSLGAVVDAGGNDLYDASDRPYALGGAVLGVAALLDLAGNDVYRGEDGCCGAGFFGAGILYDGGGVDFFEGRNFCEGSGAFGIGALVSDAGETPPPGQRPEEDRAHALGYVPVPGTGATPIRYDENDTYRCARQSQGFASTYGTGLLFDKTGNDVYSSGGHYLHRPLRPNDFQSLSQGFSIGFRPRAGGGVGLLIDDEGNDFYDAEIYAQGTSYWYSVGLLADRAGNDRYLAAQYAQGAGVHLSVGSLWDRGGDDHYDCTLGVTQGTAHDLSVGMQIDESGNDFYIVSDGQGVSITDSFALFIDGQGDDVYATPGVGQGTVTWTRGFCGAGIFLDLEGKDLYPIPSAGKDGAVWSHDLNAIGIDLGRDVQLPGEVIPEPVLTAADSARTVEDLFKDASTWNVGSARDQVARGRKALKTKGMAAVDYVCREKLNSEDGLEYEAMIDLARAFPDSFTARILPRLLDPKDPVQRNVIGLLGDLKRTDARIPLTKMLSIQKQEKHWNRVIQALGKIGDPAAAPAVRPFLRDKLERRRIVTCVAIAALKDTTSVGTLTELLGDPILTVRAAALQAVRSFGTAAAEPLAQRLAGSPRNRDVAVQTLGRVAIDLKEKSDPASLRARGLARRTLAAELDRTGVRDALCRASAVTTLLKLGGPETLDLVRARMADEYDPLVLRAFEKANGQAVP
jgi:HEAT repeat protein